MERLFFNWACIFYTLSYLTALLRKKTLCYFSFFLGIFINLISVSICLYHSLPLVPVFQKSPFIPLVFAIVSIFFTKKEDRNILTLYITGTVCFLSILYSLFPKDYYLPFLQTKTVFAFLFFICAIIGINFYLLAGIMSLKKLISKDLIDLGQSTINKAIIWGIFFQTISMFSGEIWSYIISGSPIVFKDASVLAYTSIWFYYIGFLHLYLLKKINIYQKNIFLITGIVIVFLFFLYPETGPFTIPGLLP